MSIVRYDPFRDLDRLQSEMNRLFEGVIAPTNERGTGQMTQATRLWSPAVDVAETQTEIVLRAELPGLKPEDVDIELTGDTLTLRGERKFENEDRRDSFVRVERSYGRFQRSFTLAVPVNADAVIASYKDGLLEIHLPKSQANKPRKVQVTAFGSEAVPVTAGTSNEPEISAMTVATGDGAS
ncbi:MAG: Hsp20/alpha crystallin family protein [Akkermansiaceae bacterium]|nr:Hsp20/alpha crystallin family protein [Armatimonadota bacterium]